MSLIVTGSVKGKVAVDTLYDMFASKLPPKAQRKPAPLSKRPAPITLPK